MFAYALVLLLKTVLLTSLPCHCRSNKSMLLDQLGDLHLSSTAFELFAAAVSMHHRWDRHMLQVGMLSAMYTVYFMIRLDV